MPRRYFLTGSISCRFIKTSPTDKDSGNDLYCTAPPSLYSIEGKVIQISDRTDIEGWTPDRNIIDHYIP